MIRMTATSPIRVAVLSAELAVYEAIVVGAFSRGIEGFIGFGTSIIAGRPVGREGVTRGRYVCSKGSRDVSGGIGLNVYIIELSSVVVLGVVAGDGQK